MRAQPVQAAADALGVRKVNRFSSEKNVTLSNSVNRRFHQRGATATSGRGAPVSLDELAARAAVGSLFELTVQNFELRVALAVGLRVFGPNKIDWAAGFRCTSQARIGYE